MAPYFMRLIEFKLADQVEGYANISEMPLFEVWIVVVSVLSIVMLTTMYFMFKLADDSWDAQEMIMKAFTRVGAFCILAYVCGHVAWWIANTIIWT